MLVVSEEKGMKVVLLGAGASKAYRESPTGIRMPVACDFFDTFERLAIYGHPWVLREGIIDFLYRVKRVDPFTYLRSGINIEELNSEIEEHMLEAINQGTQLGDRLLLFRSYNELTYIFSSVINEIQNGPISRAHQAIAVRLEPDDVVITFNWDTLMDRALASTTDWTLDHGYGFSPKGIYRDRWSPPQQTKNKPCPRLLKLHGSTNWITSHPMFHKESVTLTQEASPDTYEYATQPYDCHAGRYMPGYEPYSYGYYPPNILDDVGKPAPEGHVIVRVRQKVPWKPAGTAGDKGLVSIPLIIPPVRQKKYDLYGVLFDYIWKSPQAALCDAEHIIIIIGYSFPKTDIKCHELFVSAFLQRNTIPTVSVLDPQPEHITSKLRVDFGIPEKSLNVYKEYSGPRFLDSGLRC